MIRCLAVSNATLVRTARDVGWSRRSSWAKLDPRLRRKSIARADALAAAASTVCTPLVVVFQTAQADPFRADIPVSARAVVLSTSAKRWAHAWPHEGIEMCVQHHHFH